MWWLVRRGEMEREMQTESAGTRFKRTADVVFRKNHSKRPPLDQPAVSRAVASVLVYIQNNF